MAGVDGKNPKPESTQRFASRQWSADTLSTGLSFLKEQEEKQNLQYGDILAVSGFQLVLQMSFWETIINQ